MYDLVHAGSHIEFSETWKARVPRKIKVDVMETTCLRRMCGRTGFHKMRNGEVSGRVGTRKIKY